jgi:predicted transglutaminase-like cysteine proteinase
MRDDVDVEKLRTGEAVSFTEKDSMIPVTGEVRKFFIRGNVRYVLIYSFFHRKNILFTLTDGNRLVRYGKKPGKRSRHNSIDGNNDVIMYELEERDKPSSGKPSVKFISIILILIFLFSYFPITNIFSMYDYRTFLSKDFTLNELFYAVSSRINYQSDADDFWNTPEHAWNKKFGDCEEFASITGDYLNHHGIENHLASLNVKNSFTGHAVVFVKQDGVFYIIDPTRALEKSGVKRLEKAKSLRDAVLMYAELPAYIFKIPSYEGEKKILSTIL